MVGAGTISEESLDRRSGFSTKRPCDVPGTTAVSAFGMLRNMSTARSESHLVVVPDQHERPRLEALEIARCGR